LIQVKGDEIQASYHHFSPGEFVAELDTFPKAIGSGCHLTCCLSNGQISDYSDWGWDGKQPMTGC
jgi:hypothetical protein